MKLVMIIIALTIAFVTSAACVTPFSSSSTSGGMQTPEQDTPSISPDILGINNLSITPSVSPGRIEVRVQGGSDTNLEMLIVDIVSPSGTISTLTVNIPTQGETKLMSVATGRQHILVTGQFSDGSKRVIYDSYVNVPD